jgi:hypothetical protein
LVIGLGLKEELSTVPLIRGAQSSNKSGRDWSSNLRSKGQTSLNRNKIILINLSEFVLLELQYSGTIINGICAAKGAARTTVLILDKFNGSATNLSLHYRKKSAYFSLEIIRSQIAVKIAK